MRSDRLALFTTSCVIKTQFRLALHTTHSTNTQHDDNMGNAHITCICACASRRNFETTFTSIVLSSARSFLCYPFACLACHLAGLRRLTLLHSFYLDTHMHYITALNDSVFITDNLGKSCAHFFALAPCKKQALGLTLMLAVSWRPNYTCLLNPFANLY